LKRGERGSKRYFLCLFTFFHSLLGRREGEKIVLFRSGGRRVVKREIGERNRIRGKGVKII
jgi:hypothetical protein